MVSEVIERWRKGGDSEGDGDTGADGGASEEVRVECKVHKAIWIEERNEEGLVRLVRWCVRCMRKVPPDTPGGLV